MILFGRKIAAHPRRRGSHLDAHFRRRSTPAPRDRRSRDLPPRLAPRRHPCLRDRRRTACRARCRLRRFPCRASRARRSRGPSPCAASSNPPIRSAMFGPSSADSNALSSPSPPRIAPSMPRWLTRSATAPPVISPSISVSSCSAVFTADATFFLFGRFASGFVSIAQAGIFGCRFRPRLLRGCPSGGGVTMNRRIRSVGSSRLPGGGRLRRGRGTSAATDRRDRTLRARGPRCAPGLPGTRGCLYRSAGAAPTIWKNTAAVAHREHAVIVGTERDPDRRFEARRRLCVGPSPTPRRPSTVAGEASSRRLPVGVSRVSRPSELTPSGSGKVSWSR